MTTKTNDEAHGANFFSWLIIAATALLIFEVTSPQAIPAPQWPTASVETATHSAYTDRVAQLK